MRKVKFKIHTLLIILLLEMSFMSIPYVARSEDCTVPSCSDAINGCHSGGSGAVSGKCLKELSDSHCFNNIPASYSEKYEKGSGGGVGTNIDTGGNYGEVAYAAADGVIKMASCVENSGYVVVIEHQMKCSGGSKYTSVYRNLSNLYVSSGSVKAGAKLGRIGGPSPCPPEDHTVENPHLHFEVYDRGLTNTDISDGIQQSGSISAHSLDTDCGNLQALCGDCPTNTGECPKKNEPSATADAGTAAGDIEPKAEGITTPEGEEACVLRPYYNENECAFCGVFKVIFNAASIIAATSLRQLSSPCRNLVSIAFLVWLAIYILKSFGSLMGTTSGELLKGILTQGFRVALVTIILTGSTAFEAMDLTLNPIMETGLSFASSLSGRRCNEGASYMRGIRGYDSHTPFGSVSAESGGLSKNLGKSIICSIKRLEDQVTMLMGLGKYSICVGTGVEAWPFENWIPHPGYILTGVFLWLCGAILLLSFPWCLIDSILQLCIAAGMVPCAIACFAFKSTQKYMLIVWNFFINAMFNVVFMSLIIFIINGMFAKAIGLPSGYGGFNYESFVSSSPNAAQGIAALAVWSSAAIKVLGICFLCWTFFDEAKDLANAFADAPKLGGGKGIGRVVGGTAMSAATTTGKGALKFGGKGLGWLSRNTEVGRGMRGGLNDLGRWGRNHWNQWRGRGYQRLADQNSTISTIANLFGFRGEGGEVIKDEQGNEIGYTSRYRMFGQSYERTFTRDESGNWVQQKNVHQRSSTEKAFETVRDDQGQIRKITARDEQGKEYQVDEIRARHRLLGYETGLEDMTARVVTQEDGSKVVLYENADGSSRLITDLNGKALRYKTAFTVGEKKAYSHRSTSSENDAVLRRSESTRSDGSLESSSIALREGYTDALFRTNGSFDMDTYSDIMNNASDKDAAQFAVLDATLKRRGQKTLGSTFASRDMVTNKDGSFTVTTTLQDGSRRQITSKMEGDRLVVIDTQVDKNGNIVQRKDNGIQSLTKTFNIQSNGTYIGFEQYGFSAYARNKAGVPLIAKRNPLKKDGTLRRRLADDNVMAGFTEQDMSEHIQQRGGNNSYNILAVDRKRADGSTFVDRNMNSAEVREILIRDFPATQATEGTTEATVTPHVEPVQDVSTKKEYTDEDIARMDNLMKSYKNKTSLEDYIDLQEYLSGKTTKKQKNAERMETLDGQAHTFMQQLMNEDLSDERRSDISNNAQTFISMFSHGDNDKIVGEFTEWLEKENLLSSGASDTDNSDVTDVLSGAVFGTNNQGQREPTSFFDEIFGLDNTAAQDDSTDNHYDIGDFSDNHEDNGDDHNTDDSDDRDKRDDKAQSEDSHDTESGKDALSSLAESLVRGFETSQGSTREEYRSKINGLMNDIAVNKKLSAEDKAEIMEELRHALQ